MKGRVLIMTCLFCLPLLLVAQVDSDEHIRQQIEFIKHDTLPVKITRLPRAVNSTYSEYNGILFPDSTFYFSSFRSESEADHEGIFDAYWSGYIYSCQLKRRGYTRAFPLPSTINNPKYYNCNFTFNEKRTVLYFTRCVRTADAQLQCDLWKSEQRNGRWEKAKRLNRRINLPGTSTTQPNLVEYGDYSLLFFSSDRPKGFGGSDIWYTLYQDDHYSDPINLGSNINTPGNEITPFYDKNSETLYFSSDHHPGIGGYDIFYSNGSFNQWSEPDNMGVPFNSVFNDYYFSQNRHNTHGYFSSNRPTRFMSPDDTCCSDIYHYNWDGYRKVEEPVVEDTITTIEKIRNILPLTLYFHNDEPDPRSWETTTRANYRNTLASYIAMRTTYEEEYSKGLKGQEKEMAKERIRDFFADSIEQGYARLELFTTYLQQELEAGKDVRITISGYASPLHKAEYNLRLSARRIASLKNYLCEYKNGLFLPYMNGEKANHLEIHENPKGQATASKLVSDNINDKRNSVYSIAASLERRIQITEYHSN